MTEQEARSAVEAACQRADMTIGEFAFYLDATQYGFSTNAGDVGFGPGQAILIRFGSPDAKGVLLPLSPEWSISDLESKIYYFATLKRDA